MNNNIADIYPDGEAHFWVDLNNEDWGIFDTYDEARASFEEVKAEFCISTYRINKLCGNIKDFGGDFEAWINNAIQKITDYLIEKEAEECNKVIDQIRDEYGYEEYYTAGRFSNGICLYRKIG